MKFYQKKIYNKGLCKYRVQQLIKTNQLSMEFSLLANFLKKNQIYLPKEHELVFKIYFQVFGFGSNFSINLVPWSDSCASSSERILIQVQVTRT